MFIFDDDFFTHDEYKYCQHILDEMSEVPWANNLLNKIKGLHYPTNSKELKSALFELEIAYEFFKTNSDLEHEYRAGVDSTDVDFRYNSGKVNCLIEAVSTKVSKGYKGATKIDELEPGVTCFETMLGGDQLGHEMIKVQGKILEKACNKDGKPVKFPIPEQEDINVVAVDIRNFDGDEWDYMQIAYGPGAVPDVCRLTFEGKFIKGIFDKSNDHVQARVFMERVHIIAFCNLNTFDRPLFGKQNCFLCWNRRLFENENQMKKSIANVPALCNFLL